MRFRLMEIRVMSIKAQLKQKVLEEMPVFETILGWADEIATMKVKANL